MNTPFAPVRALAAGLLTSLVLFGTSHAVAQQNRSLRIVDGEVYIDERKVPKDELPDELQAEGLTAHYTFSGDIRPVVQLGSQVFVLDGERLRVATPGERERDDFFQGPPRIRNQVAPDVHVEFREHAEALSPPGPPHAVGFDRKAELLRRQAAKLEGLQRELQRGFGAQQIREVERLAHETSRHAAEAAKMASDLPRIELETYLEDMRSRNEGLFDRLVSERHLEHETMEMARRIRSMEEGRERRGEIEALRAELDEIFELKQENRRHEVAQLQHRLEELEQKVAERERMRNDIVERRLQELLGETEMSR